MFQKMASAATNAGVFPANVPKNHQNSNIYRRKNSRKCFYSFAVSLLHTLSIYCLEATSIHAAAHAEYLLIREH